MSSPAQHGLPLKVFVSYSHQDEMWRQKLGTSLRALEHRGLIQCWHDRKIVAGSAWQGEIDSELENANIILLLVSPDFMASDYCSTIEVRQALRRHEAGTARVIPIILRPTVWDHAIFFKLMALPTEGRPVSRWHDQDEALVDVVNGIKRVADELLSTAHPHSGANPPGQSDHVPKTVEQEIKFAGVANSQLKFISSDSPDEAIDKLAAVCALLDIRVGPKSQRAIADEYFDDSNLSLFGVGCSFRRRTDGPRHLVTVKRVVKLEGGFGIQRREDEQECDDQEFRRLIRETQHLRARFSGPLDGLDKLPLGRLDKVLTINNSRASVSLTTATAEYTFCYDRFYFFDEPEGRFSECFTEIEIELETGHPAEDIQLQKLTQSVSTIFGHNPHAKSKLERGLDWLQGGSEPRESICAVAFEIMGFKRSPLEWQKQALQTVNHHAKDSIRDVRGAAANDDTVCIPTGDGMILLFDDSPETIITVVASLQHRLKADRHRSRVALRIGIDVGDIFKFSDVNGNLNFGGSPMLMARQVMLLGREWHVLATKRAFSSLGITPPIESRSRKYLTESADEVEVFNIFKPRYDNADPFGNPAEPLSK